MELEGLRRYEVGPAGHVKVDGKNTSSKIAITDEAIDDVVQYVKAGNYLHVAFAAAGLSRFSWSGWRTMGLKVRQMYPDIDIDEWPADILPPNVTPGEWQAFKLVTRMEQAEAEAEAYAVLTVRKHMPDQWTAAMTYLERRFPERWRKRSTIENVDGGTVQDGIDEDALINDPAALELLHDALEQLANPKQISPMSADTGLIEGRVVEDS